MANRWGIPTEVENYVRSRDQNCVYCNQPFDEDSKNRKHKASWEHIVNDIRINGIDNIALCCVSCNASKGAKDLETWLKSNYCINNNITRETVASVVRNALENPTKIK